MNKFNIGGGWGRQFPATKELSYLKALNYSGEREGTRKESDQTKLFGYWRNSRQKEKER